MSIETTVPSKLDRLMESLSAAEYVAANSPVIPTDLKIQDNCLGGFTLDIYFHHRPQDVAAFAVTFGAAVSERPHGIEDCRTFTSAEGSVNGVLFRAWSLMAAAVEASAEVAA